jgi:hypothetical protein
MDDYIDPLDPDSHDDLEDLSKEDLIAMIDFFRDYGEYLDDALIRCEDALHDAILRPARVMPESAEEFFDYELLRQADVRRKMWQLKSERGLN